MIQARQDDPWPGHSDRVAKLLADDAIVAIARALVAKFSPGASLVTSDLLNDAYIKLKECAVPLPESGEDPMFRGFIRRMLRNSLLDRYRRESRIRYRSVEDAVAELHGLPPDPSARQDILAALIELDRTEDPRLKKYFLTYKTYHLRRPSCRFSREGVGLLDEFEVNERTMKDVGKALGLCEGSVSYHVTIIDEWLANRLRSYRAEGPPSPGARRRSRKPPGASRRRLGDGRGGHPDAGGRDAVA